MNKLQDISLAEWKEIIQVPVIRESWGLDKETAEQFAEMVNGVKFDFVSDSPGDVGDLYIHDHVANLLKTEPSAPAGSSAAPQSDTGG